MVRGSDVVTGGLLTGLFHRATVTAKAGQTLRLGSARICAKPHRITTMRCWYFLIALVPAPMAEVALPPLFYGHAVLHVGDGTPVWGTAALLCVLANQLRSHGACAVIRTGVTLPYGHHRPERSAR